MEWDDDAADIYNVPSEKIGRRRRKRRKHIDMLSVENFKEFQAVDDADDASGHDMDMCECSHRRWTHGNRRFTGGDGCSRCSCEAFVYVEPEIDTPEYDEVPVELWKRLIPLGINVLAGIVLVLVVATGQRPISSPVVLMMFLMLLIGLMGSVPLMSRRTSWVKRETPIETWDTESVTKVEDERLSTVSEYVAASADKKRDERRKKNLSPKSVDKSVSARNLDDDWSLAKGRLGALAQTFMEFENDPVSYYFTRPLLHDVSEHDTAEFYRLWNEAQRLDTDRMPTQSSRVDDFIDAVSAAERAWDVADADAKRKAEQHFTVKGKHLDSKQVRDLNTARNALAIVLDSAATASEQSAAWDRMQRILKRLDLAVSEDQTRRIRSVALTRGDVIAELEAPKMSAEAAMFAPKASHSELFADVVFDERKGELA